MGQKNHQGETSLFSSDTAQLIQIQPNTPYNMYVSIKKTFLEAAYETPGEQVKATTKKQLYLMVERQPRILHKV